MADRFEDESTRLARRLHLVHSAQLLLSGFLICLTLWHIMSGHSDG
jgi:hypothetical protein